MLTEDAYELLKQEQKEDESYSETIKRLISELDTLRQNHQIKSSDNESKCSSDPDVIPDHLVD